VKRVTFIVPMLLPRISELAAVQLIDILEQLLACVRHHYAPQTLRWHRRQRSLELDLARRPSPMLFDNDPF
jgi:hypothetical protein